MVLYLNGSSRYCGFHHNSDRVSLAVRRRRQKALSLLGKRMGEMTHLVLGNMGCLTLWVSSVCLQFRPSPGSRQGNGELLFNGYHTTIQAVLSMRPCLLRDLGWGGITVRLWESLS